MVGDNAGINTSMGMGSKLPAERAPCRERDGLIGESVQDVGPELRRIGLGIVGRD